MKLNKTFAFLISLLAIYSFSSCEKEFGFYTKSKIWAHRINTPEEANKKIALFDGIEVDLVYDSITNHLYVSHDEDFNNCMTFKEYLQRLNNTQTHYWLDIKNLYDNADAICDIIIALSREYKFRNKFFVESWSSVALKKAKEKGIMTSLWVDNIALDDEPDTTAWHEKVLEQINIANPDAISADYRMRDIIKQYFTNVNLHLWQTPANYSEKNAAITRELCHDKQIKIVLVDYDQPFLY